MNANYRENDKQPPWLEYMEHAADAGIRVTADSREELFVRAAEGMFTLVADARDIEPEELLTVSVEAPDIETLMVYWLSELNFYHQVHRWLFRKYKIVEMVDFRITAELNGIRVVPNTRNVFAEIKAVTYHGLSVRQEGDRWLAEIIFDL